MLVKDQLRDAQVENLSADPARLPEGRIWINTASRIIKAVLNGTIRELIDNNSTQTLSNKTLTSSKIGAGSANHVLVNDGSGNATSEQFLNKSRGGIGADASGLTFPSTGVLLERDNLFLDDAADTAIGTDVTISALTKSVVRLTGATLTSIAGIPSASGERLLILINTTPGAVTIRNDNTAATAANRIRTGTGADISLAVDASLLLLYNPTASRWQVIGGSGSGGNSFGSQQLLAALGSISLSNTFSSFVFRVAGSSAPITMATTPFGTTPPRDLTEITLIGIDDVNTVTINHNDATHGCVGNFSSITLARYQTAKFRYSQDLGRYVYVV